MQESDKLIVQETQTKRPLTIFLIVLSVVYGLETIAFIPLSIVDPVGSTTVPTYEIQLPYGDKIGNLYISWAGVPYFLLCFLATLVTFFVRNSYVSIQKSLFVGFGLSQGVLYALVVLQTGQYYLQKMLINAVLQGASVILFVYSLFVVPLFLGAFSWSLLIWDYVLKQEQATSGNYAQAIFWVAFVGWVFLWVVRSAEQLRVIDFRHDWVVVLYILIFFAFGNVIVFVGYAQLGWHYGS